jgi:hypothetical protein
MTSVRPVMGSESHVMISMSEQDQERQGGSSSHWQIRYLREAVALVHL